MTAEADQDDDCCGNQTNQHDNANESTFHSIHHHDASLDLVSANFCDISSFDNGNLSISMYPWQPIQ